ERNSVRLAANLDQEGAQDGEGERELELDTQAAARLGDQADGSAHAFYHVLDDVEADAASGDFSDSFFEGETRQEEKIQQFGLAQFLSDGGHDQFFLDDGAADLFGINTRAIVRDSDLKHSGGVAGFEANNGLGRFA